MIRDVFYFGEKPNAHPREQSAIDLADARARCTTEHFWIITARCDYRGFDWDFDFDVLPDDLVWTAQHNNVWPSQHQKDSGTWLCSQEASDIIVYRNDVGVVRRKNELSSEWTVPDSFVATSFDFSWHPDPTSPAYIYQFGTLLDDSCGPVYTTPNNDGTVVRMELPMSIEVPQYLIETSLEALAEMHPDELFWAVNPDHDHTGFDFSWRPTIDQANYVHSMGVTGTYFVNGRAWNAGLRTMNPVAIEGPEVDVEMFFIDMLNEGSREQFEQLKEQYPSIHRTRYHSSWVSTITRCLVRTKKTLNWIIDSRLDYTGFDFSYRPEPWQMRMIQMFGTQWSRWGTTLMVNKEAFLHESSYLLKIEHFNGINHVKTQCAGINVPLYDRAWIDHGNSAPPFDVVVTAKYRVNYRDTLHDLLSQLPDKPDYWVWVCSSICSYDDFDFTYVPDPFESEDVHVFSSDNQKYGDTFLVNVSSLRKRIGAETLYDVQGLNFNPRLTASRLPHPVICLSSDTISGNTAEPLSAFPYVEYRTADYIENDAHCNAPVQLWHNTPITALSRGATGAIVPHAALNYSGELYEYPYVEHFDDTLPNSAPLDIVFISNGESGADERYEHLLTVTKNHRNRIVRVSGVNGRVQAYHAAANASNTAWFFAVFAKLRVNPDFDWDWQPDRLQYPKHYIFYARNPVNNLVYGHQAMIAYNKTLVLGNQGHGLDFTMDSAHAVVEMMSGTAEYNSDPWTAWRTAFREAIKLKVDSVAGNAESATRLDRWMSTGNGKHGEFSVAGAIAGVEYYDEVRGDPILLRLSYEWEWLRTKFLDEKCSK